MFDEEEIDLFAPPGMRGKIREKLACFRRGLDERRKVHLHHTDAEGARSFRPDRVRHAELLADTFADEPGRDLETFLARMREAWRDKRAAE